MDIALFIGIATGVILFLYGIESFSREIKAVAGDNLRKILAKWTKNPFYGMGLGAIVTAMIQSSTATSVLTVSLVNSAIITFRQSIGIILGTNIGTTVTAFLVAFKLTEFGPWFIVLGFFLSIIRIKYSFIGKSIFYFGLVFFALSQLSAITTPLKSDPTFISYFAHLSNPGYAVLAGAAVTMLIQSSSVTTGLVVILVQSGAINLGAAIPIILGANIGTTVTGIIAAMGMDTYARRCAAVNTIFNIGGVLMFLPFLVPFTQLIERIGGTPGQMTAIAHFGFNIVSTFTFVFLAKQLEWVACKVIKSSDSEIVFETPYLVSPKDKEAKNNLLTIEKEVSHYLSVSENMMASVVSHIDLRTRDSLERVEKYQNYSFYLARKYEEALHDMAVDNEEKEQTTKLVRLLRMVDYIRQSTVSQHQIVEIPELMRLPNNEKLTELKAEIFGISSLLSQVYDHLAEYMQTQDRAELHKIDSLNAKLSKRINEKYEELVFGATASHDRINSFYMGFLTKVLSIKAKVREVRKLAVLYYGRT